jgi:hypothetical protein
MKLKYWWHRYSSLVLFIYITLILFTFIGYSIYGNIFAPSHEENAKVISVAIGGNFIIYKYASLEINGQRDLYIVLGGQNFARLSKGENCKVMIRDHRVIKAMCEKHK